MKETPIQGIFTPNVVPFYDDHRINEGELRRYTHWLIEKGVTGLYPNGSTGEFIRLSFEERLRVVEIIADEAKGRVPILAGAAEPNIAMVLEACKRCADLGCRAVSVTGPYYFKVSQDSIEHYFREIASKTPIDIILYNIPQFSNEISLEVVKRLAADCPRIVGTKDSSRDMPRFMDTLNEVKAVRPDFTCLIGCEEILLPALLMGADGGTIASSGVAPEAIMQLYGNFRSGNIAEAKRIQFKLLELIKTMFAAGNFPEGFREGVNLRGFQTGRGPQPMSPHEMEHFNAIRSKLACLLKDCGFHDAAGSCQNSAARVDSMLDRIRKRLP
jgi:dihydrodipicolinate synthase/N-acetylneuraminate lyase